MDPGVGAVLALSGRTVVFTWLRAHEGVRGVMAGVPTRGVGVADDDDAATSAEGMGEPTLTAPSAAAAAAAAASAAAAAAVAVAVAAVEAGPVVLARLCELCLLLPRALARLLPRATLPPFFW